MLLKLSRFLYRLSSPLTVVLAVFVYVFFLSTIMPAQSVDSQAYAGDWGAPDRHLFYTPTQLYTQVLAWSEMGRRDYIEFRLGWDIGWALAYTAFLVTITSCALRRGVTAQDRRLRWNVFALLPLCFDYMENGLGIFLIASLPQQYPLVAWLASGVTAMKWFALSFAHLLMFYALVIALRNSSMQRI
jgi:hypothetical protein